MRNAYSLNIIGILKLNPPECLLHAQGVAPEGSSRPIKFSPGAGREQFRENEKSTSGEPA